MSKIIINTVNKNGVELLQFSEVVMQKEDNNTIEKILGEIPLNDIRDGKYGVSIEDGRKSKNDVIITIEDSKKKITLFGAMDSDKLFNIAMEVGKTEDLSLDSFQHESKPTRMKW